MALGIACTVAVLSIPVTLAMLCLIPRTMSEMSHRTDFTAGDNRGLRLPFYFVGMIVSAVVTKVDLPIGRLYAPICLALAGVPVRLGRASK